MPGVADRGDTTKRLRELSARLLRTAPGVVALAGAVALLAIQVPLLRPLLNELGLENDQRFHAVVITLLLTTVLLELRELNAGIRREATAARHLTDPGAMYELLKTRADAIRRREHRRIEILGLTLFSAWIHLGFWLDRDGCTDWSLTFATLAADATSVAGAVPEDWIAESAAKAAEIRRYAALPSTRDRRHRLEVVEYDFVPGVHGFRLGNGDVFLSFVRWDGDGRLSKRFTYEFVPCSDDSPRADAYRELFDNWFTHATRGARP